mgnify:CR=1 FL=1
MEPLEIKDVISVMDGEVSGRLSGVIHGVSIDTRSIHPGEAFFAVKGERTDGQKFSRDAEHKGAALLVLHDDPQYPATVPYLVVKNTVLALGELASFYRQRFDLTVVGVTGSVGKTTTRRMIAGLEEPTAGAIYIGDRLVNLLPPRDRDISMVFQSYAVWPHMKARGSGSIIMISSGSGRRAHAGWSAYCASKFGVMGLADALAKEGRPYGIRCNVICPGATDTDQRRANFPDEDRSRLLRPEDVAKAAVFFASDESEWVSGPGIDVRREPI